MQQQHTSEGWWKCNVDASFYETSAAGTNICNHHLASCEGGAMAILGELRAASARGWNHIVFESDFKIVMECPKL
jgi:hypothetical protein